MIYYIDDPFPKPIENVALSANERFAFEIDSDNVLVGSTLERGNVPKSAFQLPKTENQIKTHLAVICHCCHFITPKSNSEMRAPMPRAAHRPTYLANSVNSVNLVFLDLLSSRRWFAPLGSENSHFFK